MDLKSSMPIGISWSRRICIRTTYRKNSKTGFVLPDRTRRCVKSMANRCRTRRSGWRECFADAYANKFDPASNIRDMEREGIDVSVLFPTIGLYIMWRDDIDPELSAAICRAYNTWLADYCDYDRKRLYGVMLLPLQDPARAVEELKYAREKLGLVGIFWRPNKFCGRTFASPDYYPIYETASDLGVTVCVHEGARTILT